jgi:transcriptional regulator
LYDVLKKLTAHFENDAHSPSLIEKMDEAYVRNNMKAIIAFEIEITGIDHVFKMSQNRDAKTYDHIIDHLKEGGAEDKAVAAVMEENKHNVFHS